MACICHKKILEVIRKLWMTDCISLEKLRALKISDVGSEEVFMKANELELFWENFLSGIFGISMRKNASIGIFK